MPMTRELQQQMQALSDENMIEELTRRKKERAREAREQAIPEPLHEPDYRKLRDVCIRIIVEAIRNKKYATRSSMSEVYDAAMKAVYGDDIFEKTERTAYMD